MPKKIKLGKTGRIEMIRIEGKETWVVNYTQQIHHITEKGDLSLSQNKKFE